MQIEVNGQRNITLGFDAPKKFKLTKDGVEIPYLRTGKNSFRLSKNIDGVVELEELPETTKKIVKPIQLQPQQMALVNPNDVIMINQAAQQLEIEQNLLSETQKRFENVQNYIDIQQQRINETIEVVNALETDNSQRISATEQSIFNLAGEIAKVENEAIDSTSVVYNSLESHKAEENPHNITKKTIGLEKVDNTSDLDKPISKAVQNALDKKANKDEIEAIREELGEYQEKNERFTNALSNYTGGLGGNELPSGGFTGQILAKKTDQTGDVEWVDSIVDVDDELSTTSENPVQNKVITNALNSKADISDIPTVNDATLIIQKNNADIGTFTANASTNATINITVPTSASDVGALPDTTKYGSSLSLTINSSTFVVTAQLKDQNGDNLGSAQTIDLPLESVVVNGAYDDVTKKIILTLQNGNTIEFSVADLVSGLQSEITSDNMLDADLVDDSTSINKFVTSSDITTWNGKQDTISDLSTIRSGASAGATAVQSVTTGTTNGTIKVDGSDVSVYGLGSAAYTSSTAYDASGSASTAETNAKNYADSLSSNYATAAQGSKADTAVQPADLATVATTGDYDDLLNKPTIPAAQVNSDWNANSGVAQILNKPTIPTVNNSTITITQGGVTKGSFTLNQASGDTIALDSGGSIINTDGVTINTNADDELQAIGVIEKNAGNVKYDWVGTSAEYTAQAVATTHPDWVCYITDDETPSNFANTDLSNLTSTGKSAGTSMSFPSSRYDNLSWNTNPNTQTAPANGWMYVDGLTTTQFQYVRAIVYDSNNVQKYSVINWTPASNGFAFIVPVLKGDIVVWSAGPGQLANVAYFRFIYAQGEL